MIPTSTITVSNDSVVMYLFAPLIALFIYLLIKLFSEFRW